ncbi:MAG: Cof-type HAD-IIB family hydrolase [Elusimicrobiota bacterium]|nr:Cof-type HAD-IIB family hydrolase [Elusimicrobiota bacterium]
MIDFKMPEAIFFDVDGTLFSHSTLSVPESSKKSLQAARNMGIKLFVATGRHRLFLEDIPWMMDFGFDGYITLNGQFCFSGDAVIYENYINQKAVEILLNYLKAQKETIPFMFLEKDMIYKNFELLQGNNIRISKKCETFLDINDCYRALKNKIYQINTYAAKDIAVPIIQEMEYCSWTGWGSQCIDIIPLKANKAESVKKVIEYFGFSMDKIAVFGDGDNDAEMLSLPLISIAMGNASDKAKAAANYITDDIDKDGLSKAMSKLLHL